MADPRADLSRLHVVVPVRTLAGGKARLGGALDAEERQDLILGMLSNELDVLEAWGRADAVHVVSPDPDILAAARTCGVGTREQATEGLNDALVEARDAALDDGATALLVLPADLPLLDVEALERFLDAADAALTAASGGPLVVVAPADARRGTNALLLSPPDVIDPAFGEQSLEAHVSAAARADAALQLVVDPRLGFDLDTPSDIARLDAAVVEGLVHRGIEVAERLAAVRT